MTTDAIKKEIGYMKLTREQLIEKMLEFESDFTKLRSNLMDANIFDLLRIRRDLREWSKL